MHMQAMNNFGNFNRGFGGQPQPQRQGMRRGNNRGGGGFRNSRFDHNNQRGPNQGQRPNVQQQQQQNKPAPAQTDKPQNPPAAQQNNAAANTPPEKKPSPVQAPKPVQNTPAKPAQTPQPQAQAAKPAAQQPQQQKPAAAPAQQNAAPKSLMADKIDKPVSHSPNQNQNQQQVPVNGGNFGGPNNNRGSWQGGNRQSGPGGPGGPRQGGAGNKPFMNRQGGPGGPGGPGSQGGQGGQGGPPRNQRNQRGPMQNDGKLPALREEHMLSNKLKDLQGPLLELPPLEQAEVKFNGRSRLYIGNLHSDVTEEDVMKLFREFGEPAELFINKEKNFGFIKMDYRENAERAKRGLDGQVRAGRPMRVRFAPHNSAVRVKNLPAFVSNELLYRAFEIFGKIERAYVKVDDRGKTLGEGVVEYARKPSALAAIRNCTDKCFFLTSSLRPVIVESFEEPDEVDGFPEKNLPKKHPEFQRAREVGPRFSEPGSFEHEYGTRWKQLHELHRQKEEALKKELAAEEEKLEAQMEYAKYEHETELLREQLRAREQDRERQKRSWEMAERAAEERREADRAAQQLHEGELAQRMRAQDSELRRRQQENTLFVQAQRLNSMLDRQEQGIFDSSPMDGGRDQYSGRGFDDMQQSRGWEGPRPLDDFPNKRRRF